MDGPVGTTSQKSLQHTATHCKTLQHTIWYNLSKVTATHSNKLQHTATHCDTSIGTTSQTSTRDYWLSHGEQLQGTELTLITIEIRNRTQLTQLTHNSADCCQFVLQYVAVALCCSVLQYVAVALCYSVLQYVAVALCCSVLQWLLRSCTLTVANLCCSMLQWLCVAVCCSDFWEVVH